MTFFQRFKRYLIGFALGIILTGVFFKDRLSVFTSWLPGNVVKNEIYESTISYSEKASCQLTYYNFENHQFEKGILDDKVLFSESSVRTNPRIYSLVSDDGSYQYTIQIKENNSTVLTITKDGDSAPCN